MLTKLGNLATSRKLENAIFFSIVLFVFKIIFPVIESTVFLFVNELLVTGAVFFWTLYVIDFVHSKITAPLSIVLNAGILNALIFFIISVSSAIFNDVADIGSKTDFVYTIFSTLLSFVFVASLTYIFSAFRELFYLRQKRDPQKYFNTMVLFVFLASISNSLMFINSDLDFLKNTFYVVAIVMISINSLRVSWIAFMIKKQKLYLLIISVVLSALFGINFALTLNDTLVTDIIINFSPALHTFLNLTMIYGTIYFAIIFFTALFHLPTAEAFDRKAEELSSLIDLSKLVTQVFDFNELAETIVSTTNKVCNSDSSWLVTKKGNSYEISSVNNIGYVIADKLTTAILDENSDMNELVTLNQRSIKVKVKNDLHTVNFNALAIAPLKVHDKINGYLFAGRKQNMKFDVDDLKAVGAFADYAAVALENAKLLEESLEKERLERELEVAREIQSKILPSRTPVVKNLEISALFVPAFEVGGDYYDFFRLSDDKLGFVIADVSGKGIQAAFIMAEVKGIFESLSLLIESPKELLSKANEILKNSLEKKSFVTAIYGVIDVKEGRLSFARCGHNPLYISRDGKMTPYTPNGIGLGLDFGSKFSDNLKEMEIKLNNDDIIILYTDGIPESKNTDMDDFGYERFERVILENKNKTLDEISTEIMQRVSVFSEQKAQHDDITLVIFKWNFNNNLTGEC
ncbi:MAG: SpoIIE family protein phosphatase [Melioribacteraceae bacterium]|nr:SpoIIE family protein phosphatase [Melioribacteraceae bacterium]MCF8355339.1 SpoIIE family protein phosphatase [Melioribacteraceae bacterium]MCF8392347.1 SpoIIE family protein phosphatase [Melioribacteraceae bacterium]MCF8417867.1 SpoIIE family protein phosphatase [Melioribacteraceae bacterium]